MTGSVVGVLVPSLLAGAAVALALPPRARTARSLLAGLSRGGGSPLRRAHEAPTEDLIGRHRVLVAVLAGAAPVLLVGGPVGLVAAGVATGLTHRMLSRREPAAVRRRREEISRTLPEVVDLLGLALAAGAPPVNALAVVAETVQGPAAEELSTARQGLALGRDPVTVWRELSHRPGLSALGRTMARAMESGASVSQALHRLADDLDASSRAADEARARTVAVKAAAPLGLCLLPAFVLVGVVPLVAGTVSALLAA